MPLSFPALESVQLVAKVIFLHCFVLLKRNLRTRWTTPNASLCLHVLPYARDAAVAMHRLPRVYQ